MINSKVRKFFNFHNTVQNIAYCLFIEWILHQTVLDLSSYFDQKCTRARGVKSTKILCIVKWKVFHWREAANKVIYFNGRETDFEKFSLPPIFGLKEGKYFNKPVKRLAMNNKIWHVHLNMGISICHQVKKYLFTRVTNFKKWPSLHPHPSTPSLLFMIRPLKHRFFIGFPKIQQISYKRYLKCTLVQWRLSIYLWGHR